MTAIPHGWNCANDGCDTHAENGMNPAYVLYLNATFAPGHGKAFCSAKCLVEWASREAVKIHASENPEAAAELEPARLAGNYRNYSFPDAKAGARAKHGSADRAFLESEIRKTFGGHINGGSVIVQYMSVTHRWGNKRTRRRIGELVVAGILTTHIDKANNWTVIYDIVKEADDAETPGG